jgi:hypothetical protein
MSKKLRSEPTARSLRCRARPWGESKFGSRRSSYAGRATAPDEAFRGERYWARTKWTPWSPSKPAIVPSAVAPVTVRSKVRSG